MTQRLRPYSYAALAGLVVSTGGCTPPVPPIDPAVHRAAVDTWHADRVAGLRRPDGWLSLVGLFWLDDGVQTFGTLASHPVQFPETAGYPSIGTFDLRDSLVRMRVADGVPVRYDGRSVTALDLFVERVEFPEREVQLGSLRWHVVRRNNRYAIRLKDRRSPQLAAFEGIDRFPVDTAWYRPARFARYDPPKPIHVPNYMGYVSEQTSPGAVVFELGGETVRLDVTGSAHDTAFFIPFGDGTNGFESYGGGRFVWIDGPDADGRTAIDFNRAYNPPCVFSAYATCPLPPRQNRLRRRIPAGERTFPSVPH